jgi:hypothetical protein
MDARVVNGWALRSGMYEGMAMRVRTDRYALIGATRRARRFAVVWGAWRSGLREGKDER